MKKILLTLNFLLLLFPANSETIKGDYEKLQKCLSEFYQGRPRDYPFQSENDEIVIYFSANGHEVRHKKKLRGMEIVCYRMFAPVE